MFRTNTTDPVVNVVLNYINVYILMYYHLKDYAEVKRLPLLIRHAILEIEVYLKLRLDIL